MTYSETYRLVAIHADASVDVCTIYVGTAQLEHDLLEGYGSNLAVSSFMDSALGPFGWRALVWNNRGLDINDQ